MSVTSATDSWQDGAIHVRTYLRKKSPRKGHDLVTVSVTEWETIPLGATYRMQSTRSRHILPLTH